MLFAYERYSGYLPECLGGMPLPPDAPDYVDAPDCLDAPDYGTLGFRRWNKTIGFIGENVLDDYERAAESWGLVSPDATSALLLMRLTLYRLPLEHYARLASCWGFRLSNGADDETADGGEDFARLCDDVASFRLLWLRLCFPDIDFNASPMGTRAQDLYRCFWRVIGAGEEPFLYGQNRKDIAALIADFPDAGWMHEDWGIVGEQIQAEAIYRNLAFWAVGRGLLSAIDAYAAGVPAAYL